MRCTDEHIDEEQRRIRRSVGDTTSRGVDNATTYVMVGLWAVVAFGAVLVFAGSEAVACSPGDPWQTEVIDDETPDCLELTPRLIGFGHKELRVVSECDEEVKLEAVECVECKETAVVEADAETQFVLEGEDWSQYEENNRYGQHYQWRMGDREGDWVAESRFFGDTCSDWDPHGKAEGRDDEDPSDDDSGLFESCAHTGGPMAVGALLAAALLIMGVTSFVSAVRRTSSPAR